MARAEHARIRASWADALRQPPGSESAAVQTLRNSLVSACL
jgi:hypothetical protein